MIEDDDTPARARERVQKTGTRLAVAALELKRARDAEVEAEHVYEARKRALLLSPECPRVTRSAMTAAERDAWVEDRADEEHFKFRVATAIREAAKDNLAICQTQAMLAMALLRSVDAAYAMAGSG